MASFRPWREVVPGDFIKFASPETIAWYDRDDAGKLAAIDVWGNYDDAVLWYLRPSDAFGAWDSPQNTARSGDEGLARVMAVLDELRPTVTPRPVGPQQPGGRRRVFKPRISR